MLRGECRVRWRRGAEPARFLTSYDASYAGRFPRSSAGWTILGSAPRMRRLPALRLGSRLARRGLSRRGPAGLGRRAGLARVLGDEPVGRVARLVVGALVVRRLHEVRARAVELAADAVVERQLQAAHGVDHNAGRVGRVPHLELELGVQRHAAEGLALQADVGPLAVGQPRHVVRGAHVDVVGGHLQAGDRGHRIGLGDLLGLQALALEHVEEVHVAAHVELRGAPQLDAALVEEAGQHPVGDGGADLGLDVVADDRQAGLLEALVPVVLARDEDGDAVDERAAGLEDLLDVPLGRLLGADGQVGDDDVRVRLLEDRDDVGRLAGRLGDLLRGVLADAVMGHPTMDLDAELLRQLGELDRVVGVGPDRLAEVLAHLRLVDVEGARELDVADVVAAEVDVHEPRDAFLGVRVAIVVDALHEGFRAVAHADDGAPDLVVLVAGLAVRGGAVGRRGAVAVGAQGEVPFDEFPTDPTPSLTAGYRSEAGCASRVSSLRTCRIRCKTVMVPSPASTYTAGASRSRSANTIPAERITTRTARLAMPTLHSTPRASARARV